MAQGEITTYIATKKQDIVNNNGNFSFNVLPFDFQWKGRKEEINRIEIKNDGIRYDGEKTNKKNFERYRKNAPDMTQTDSYSVNSMVNICFYEGVAKAEIEGQTLIIDGSHWVTEHYKNKTLYISHFELEWMEDWKEGEDNKLVLKIKERKIVNNGNYCAPTISYLLINFGDKKAEREKYKANLQVGKKYCFNTGGEGLKNTKILTGKKLDLNNSADNIPEIRVFKEEPEIIVCGAREKNQIRQYFIQNKIKKITLEGDNLVIEYNNQQKERQEINNHELQKYRQFIEKQPNQSLSLAELETNTLTNQNNNKLYQGLAIGTVGVVIFLMGYLIVKQKSKRKYK